MTMSPNPALNERRMSSRRKTFLLAALAIVFIYVFTPLVAGMVGTRDPRGPKIFVSEHHQILHRIGEAMAGRRGSKVPMRGRSWFYGIEGESTPKRDLRKEIEEYEHRTQN
jgi:hypothetical protein